MSAQSTPTPETPKRTRAPELVQAALRRDIRLLNERRIRLTAIYEAKALGLSLEIGRLTEELNAVTAKLDPGTNGDAKGGG